jgi:nitrile hydratase subunit beta
MEWRRVFRVGEPVRVARPSSPGHHRAPAYLFGKTGVICRVNAAYPCAEDLAERKPVRETLLYSVRFRLRDLWGIDGEDALIVDLYAHWLAPIPSADCVMPE